MVVMSRGRGFSSSRGSSYRGSSRGGSSWGSSRGYSSPRGGTGTGARFSSFSNTFEPQRTKYGSSADRYGSSRSHTDDYRKPYKSEQGGYSGREHGHRSSPERKRMRTESVSSRHENYGGTTSDGGYGRYESSGYSERRSFSSDRKQPASLSRREEFRKPPPPPSLSSPRGRGRISSRGSLRSRIRDRPARRRLVDSSYAVRRRVILTRTSSDYPRRLKITKMRSAIIRRTRKAKVSDKEDDSDKEKDVEDEKPESTAAVVVATATTATTSTTTTVSVKNEEKEDKEKSDDENEKKTSPAKKSPKKDKEETDEKEERKSDDSDGEDKSKKKFIRLVCPHCQTKCPTFIKYSMHLQSGRHMAAMRKVALRQKSVLGQMRAAQRTAQRELEKNAENLAPRTNFCPLCKLNYKQPKVVHQASDAHKNMKKFLMPLCKICKITFKSPMVYESHCCSIEHIKRKQLMANGGDRSDKEDGSGIDDDNLENFMTIDSVGDVDEEDSGDGKKKDADGKQKEVINVGIENIRKVEVYYCDLCRMYLPRADDEELDKILAKHCKQRTHLQKYIRYKEDKELTKRAERLQRKETAEKERERDKTQQDVKNENSQGDGTTKDDGTTNSANTTQTNNEDEEDKIWDDVNKDIGDILQEEVQCDNKFDDDEDEEEEDSTANDERYDRFRPGEKPKDEPGKEVVAVVVVEEKSEKETEKIVTETEGL